MSPRRPVDPFRKAFKNIERELRYDADALNYLRKLLRALLPDTPFPAKILLHAIQIWTFADSPTDDQDIAANLEYGDELSVRLMQSLQEQGVLTYYPGTADISISASQQANLIVEPPRPDRLHDKLLGKARAEELLIAEISDLVDDLHAHPASALPHLIHFIPQVLEHDSYQAAMQGLVALLTMQEGGYAPEQAVYEIADTVISFYEQTPDALVDWEGAHFTFWAAKFLADMQTTQADSLARRLTTLADSLVAPLGDEIDEQQRQFLTTIKTTLRDREQ